MSRTPIVVAALAAATLASSGCGKSAPQSASTKSGKMLTRTELLEQVNTICAHLHARRNSTRLNNAKAVVRLAPGLSSYEKAVAAELSSLVSSPELMSAVHEIATGIDVLAEDTTRLVAYAKISNPNQPALNQLFHSMNNHQRHIVSVARENDFVECTRS